MADQIKATPARSPLTSLNARAGFGGGNVPSHKTQGPEVSRFQQRQIPMARTSGGSASRLHPALRRARGCTILIAQAGTQRRWWYRRNSLQTPVTHGSSVRDGATAITLIHESLPPDVPTTRPDTRCATQHSLPRALPFRHGPPPHLLSIRAFSFLIDEFSPSSHMRSVREIVIVVPR